MVWSPKNSIDRRGSRHGVHRKNTSFSFANTCPAMANEDSASGEESTGQWPRGVDGSADRGTDRGGESPAVVSAREWSLKSSDFSFSASGSVGSFREGVSGEESVQYRVQRSSGDVVAGGRAARGAEIWQVFTIGSSLTSEDSSELMGSRIVAPTSEAGEGSRDELVTGGAGTGGKKEEGAQPREQQQQQQQQHVGFYFVGGFQYMYI